ncbi:TraI domain-containing protein [Xenorhabdus sp. Sc-CR9]|uniref:TraI domain-containing protein n=1 Tax=Xenorhabdus sp. Sc-CR9 TaxID=2584468 RepID=UPI001F251AD8|nr:TraI domain-containing protein [Xenorhabdus sp. Sc-CR9]
MFQRFKSRFTRDPSPSQKAPGQSPESVRDAGGYFRPLSAEVLLATSERGQYLRQLWENSALPAGLYQQFYLDPLRQLCARVQRVPATQEGIWSYRGGFIDLTLQFTACTVRLAKGHLLPPGVAPETQAAQSLLWQAVVFWAALFYHLLLLQQLEGELEDGHHWQPGICVPDKPFRFRFRTPENTPSVPQEALLAACLLPEKAMMWLVSVPEVWHCLMQHLNGCPSTVPLIDALLQDAAGQMQSPLLKSTEPSEPALNPVSLPATSGAAAVSDTAEDTRTLLSLFQTPE